MNHKVYTVKEMLKKTSLMNPKLYCKFGYEEIPVTKEVENYYILGICNDGKGFYVIEPSAVRVGKLKLRKFAYLWEYPHKKHPDSFDYLFDYYRAYENRKDETWEYIQVPEWHDVIYINLMDDGNCYDMDDRQIRWIDQPDMVLMHLKFDTFKNINVDKYFKKEVVSAKSKRFRSLCFDFYDHDEENGYIRISFNRNSEAIIVTTDGTIYGWFNRYEKRKTDRVLLKKQLGIKSKQAQKEFDYMIDAIINA